MGTKAAISHTNCLVRVERLDDQLFRRLVFPFRLTEQHVWVVWQKNPVVPTSPLARRLAKAFAKKAQDFPLLRFHECSLEIKAVEVRTWTDREKRHLHDALKCCQVALGATNVTVREEGKLYCLTIPAQKFGAP